MTQVCKVWVYQWHQTLQKKKKEVIIIIIIKSFLLKTLLQSLPHMS